jgi:Sec-independent protein secretion pathway component TatC
MAATVGLFLAGAAFGYFYVLPGALKILIVDFGKNFTPMVTIEEYTSFFLSIILGLGISFELPILIFFLAMFGIVSPRSCGRTSATRFWRSFWWRPSSAPAPTRGPCASTRFPCWRFT